MSSTNIFEQFALKNDQNNFDDVTSVQNSISEKPTNEQFTGNVFEQAAQKQQVKNEDQYSSFNTLIDIGQQIVSKGISGLGGAYGNIASTFGLQRQEGQQLPGEQARNSLQFQILEKINRGETPTAGELMLLSDSEEPVFPRFPTSQNIESGIQQLTGINNGKTPAGRIAGQGAKFLGEAAALGGTGKILSASGAAGLAGQTLREANIPESIATGVEIATSLSPSIISKNLAPIGSKAKNIVEKGRKIGLTEQQIAPLIQSENKLRILSKVSQKGEKTQKVFQSIKQGLGDSYETIKSNPMSQIKFAPIDKLKLRKEFVSIRNDLSKTLQPSPDKEAAIKYINDSLESLLRKDITPEHLINFWQDINKSVKWNSISGGKKSLSELKKPILDTLKRTSPKIAEDFEITNELYSKYVGISKKLKPNVLDSFINKAEFMSIPVAGTAFLTGNPLALKAIGGEIATRYLAREMLVNPYFQTIAGKLVNNFNAGSVKAIEKTVIQAKEYLERKYPNEDWSFLIDTYQTEE